MPSMKEIAKIAAIAVVAVIVAKRIPFTASYL
jgi:hypothetical protein